MVVEEDRKFNRALLIAPAAALLSLAVMVSVRRGRQASVPAAHRPRHGPGGAMSVNWGLAIFGVNCFGPRPSGMRFPAPPMIRRLAEIRSGRR